MANPLSPDKSPLVGTSNADIITGSIGPDTLAGGPGPDRLTGGGGPDTFRFSLGDPVVDVVLDFVPGLDKIQIDGVVVGSKLDRLLKGQPQAKKVLGIVDGSRKASTSKRLYAYDETSGTVYYNANGSKKGFGSGGGAVVDLAPGLSLKSSDFLFSYAPGLA